MLNFLYLPAHIFFDDAFEISDHSDDDIQVNRFVKLLVTTLDEADLYGHYLERQR